MIVKHAPIFRPLKNLVETAQNHIYFNLIKHDIAVYVSHTNIDIVPDGLNDWFCDLLDIKNRRILSPSKDDYGIGRVGDISPLSFEDLAKRLRKFLIWIAFVWCLMVRIIL